MSTYEPIASQTLGSAAASVTFSSIPQGYTDLVIVMNGALSGSGVKLINFNGVSTLYSCTTLIGYGTGTSSGRYTDPYIDVWNAAANPFVNIIQINNYSNSTTFKTYLARQGAAATSTEAIVGLWRSTAAITTVSFSASGGQTYASGTTFSLYGIQVGTAAQKAQGGNIVTTDGTYVYHTFTSSGAFIPSQALTVDYLVVAGGGGGGIFYSGGGGAGGLLYATNSSLTSNTNYTVTIGAGGAASDAAGTGSNGSNSVFGSSTALGGGFGGMNKTSNPQIAAGSGGSGGGGAGYDQNLTAPYYKAGGAATQGNSGGATGYGNAGGQGYYPSGFNPAGGGGGGAGAVGGDGTNSAAGNGGIGRQYDISGTNTYYAGGGGGSGENRTRGTGGSGGGGNGAQYLVAFSSAGSANTGGGGGAGVTSANNYVGSAGGSGIVIIRYLA